MNIIAVVVLYRCRPGQSSSIVSLVRSWEHCAKGGLEMKLVIYDNSPEAQEVTVPMPFDHQYVHDGANGGLVAAYNHALNSDPGGQHQWLLLLDQDSTLPDNFLEQVFQALNLIGRDDGVAAAVPKILQGGRPISPALVEWGRVRPVKNIEAGIGQTGLTAINSGALVRTIFLKGIGGFNQQFKLDYLDHWLFSEIKRRGKKVYVTGAVAGHDLSIGNQSPVTPGRFRSIRAAETLFYREYADGWNFTCHVLNLVLRSFRYLLKGRWNYSLMTARHFLRILANQKT